MRRKIAQYSKNSDKLSFYYYFILSLRIEYVQNQIAFVIENISKWKKNYL